MALTIDEEKYIKDLYTKKQKNDQVTILGNAMWIDVEVLKASNNKDKWIKIVERKNKFYNDRDQILN